MIKSLCIIPARGGSKRVPRKNILPLNGIPLISHTIRAAKDANVFTDIIVSTEDPEISEVALDEGVMVDHRPEAMCLDTVTKVQVVKEYIERTKAESKYDYVACMLPTCPFRKAEDVVQAYNQLVNQNDINYLIGVTEYEFPMQLALEKTSEDKVRMLFPEKYKTTRSQDIPKRFHPNGSIYMATMDGFIKNGNFFNEEMLVHTMSPLRSFDIDYPWQFEIAEMVAKRNEKNEIE